MGLFEGSWAMLVVVVVVLKAALWRAEVSFQTSWCPPRLSSLALAGTPSLRLRSPPVWVLEHLLPVVMSFKQDKETAALAGALVVQ